jgi:protein-tyrosine-phosphatase
MAEYMLGDRLEEDAEKLTITSAGVAARKGRPASQPAVEVLKEIGIDGIAMHSAQPVDDLELAEDDLLLTMTPAHLSRLPRRYKNSPLRTATLKEFTGGKGGISDPFGAPVERYRDLRKELDPLIQTVYERLKENGFDLGGS